MKQTAVEWLVENILTQVQDFEDGDVETEEHPFKFEYVNKYIGMVDLSEFVNKAKEMENQQKGYSEEEVKFIITEALQSVLVKVDLEQWFNQFHKNTNK